MPCCKKALSTLLSGVLLAWLFAAPAQADGIFVNMAEIRLGEDGFQLFASYDINPSSVVKQALSRGTPIYFAGEFLLTRSRLDWLDTAQQTVSRGIQRIFVDKPTTTHWSWLDKEIYKGEQTIKISYSVLTGRYRISRGALFQNFSSLEDALNMLARQSSATIPAELMKKEGNYMAAVRLRLDIAQLPKPLQVNALTDNDWTLDSGWYRWVINPAGVVINNDSKAE